MAQYLDKTGVQTLWNKVKAKDEATLTAAKNDATSKDTALKNELNTAIAKNASDLATLKGRVDTFLNGTNVDDVIDTLNEIVKYIEEDESGAASMLASIEQNAKDIDALETSYTQVETNTADIATLETAVENYGVRLSNIDSSLSSYGTRITANETAISNKQPLDADLTAIAGLSGTSGLLKKTAANTWKLDTTTYATQSALESLTGSDITSESASYDGQTIDAALDAIAQAIQSIPAASHFVSVADEQTVTGKKTFSAATTFSNNVTVNGNIYATGSSQTANFYTITGRTLKNSGGSNSASISDIVDSANAYAQALTDLSVDALAFCTAINEANSSKIPTAQAVASYVQNYITTSMTALTTAEIEAICV